MSFKSFAWAVICLLVTAAPAFAQSAAEVQRMVIAEAQNSRVPPALALAVARVESNFDPRAASPVGARGVMQIMPKTARDVFGVGENELWNARLNIQLGIDYLEQLHDQYGGRWDLALSHYNGGTLDGGSGPYAVPHAYTAKYVADVQRWTRIYSQQVFHQAPGGFSAYEVGRAPPVTPRAPYAYSADPSRIDPLEYDDWAEAARRQAMRRQAMNRFPGW